MSALWHILIDPLRYSFMQQGLLAVVLVGMVCAIVGTFVALRGLTFLGDALAHAILPGVAVGYLVHGGARGPLFWWALAAAILTATGVGGLAHGMKLKEDAVIGIVFSGMFALGIALISTMRTYAVDLAHFLFGNVLAITPADLWLIALCGGGVALVVALLFKEFLVISFDPVLAATLRLPVGLLNQVLLILMAVCVVVSLQTVGVGLMMAMLVTPPSAAYMITRRLSRMMALAAFFGAFSGLAGLYLSYYFNMASGAAIVLVSTAIFLLAWLLSPRRSGLWRRGRGRREP
jgi:manganese/iron transport system permease protein